MEKREGNGQVSPQIWIFCPKDRGDFKEGIKADQPKHPKLRWGTPDVTNGQKKTGKAGKRGRGKGSTD